MNVLSLCDGISCLRIALQRGGHKVDKYFASEIKKSAIKCSKDNWNDIIQVGDITKLHFKDGYLYNDSTKWYVGKFDLVAFGSPCQSFSSANVHNDKEHYGLNGKSKLFFECLRVLKEVNPKYFLFENVKMKKDAKSMLDKYMGVNGILINSNLVSYQNRARYYWTNIPNVTIPEDKHISFQDYIDRNTTETKLPYSKSYIKMWEGGNSGFVCKDITHSDKVNCITARQTRCPNAGLIACEDFCRTLTQREQEIGQTLPVGYTKCLPYNQASDVIGNGWTVDVIVHILKGLEHSVTNG